MMRFLRPLAVLAALAAVPPAAHAQGFGLWLGSGPTYNGAIPSAPNGSPANAPGFNLNAFVVIPVTRSPFSVRFELTYLDTQAELPDTNRRVNHFGITAMYDFNAPREWVIRPYLIAGGGGYSLRVTGPTVQANDTLSYTRIGANVGAGLTAHLGGFRLFSEARYHLVSYLGESRRYIPIIFGIRLGD